MTLAIIFIAVSFAVAVFGAGYTLGYNIAKHPDKVKAQADAVVADVKAKL